MQFIFETENQIWRSVGFFLWIVSPLCTAYINILDYKFNIFFCQLLFDKLMDNSLCSCSRLYFCFSLKRASTIFPYTTCLDCFRPFLICSVLAGKHLWRITLANRSLLVLSPSGWHMKNFYMTTFYLLFDSLNVKYCLVNQSSNSSS